MLVYNSSLIRKILLTRDDNKQGNPQLNRIKRIRDFEMLIPKLGGLYYTSSLQFKDLCGKGKKIAGMRGGW